jgi:hypothetical protein
MEQPIKLQIKIEIRLPSYLPSDYWVELTTETIRSIKLNIEITAFVSNSEDKDNKPTLFEIIILLIFSHEVIETTESLHHPDSIGQWKVLISIESAVSGYVRSGAD